MKNSLLIALLGLTVSVVTPSIATAEDFKFGPNKSYKNDRGHKHSNRHVKKHVAKQHNQKRRVHKAKPPKLPHQRIITKFDNKIHNRHNKRHDNKRRHVNKHANNHRNQRHYNRSKPSFSISWNSNTPNVIYDNGYYAYDNDYYYNDAPRYANSVYDRQQKQQRKIRKGMNKGQLVKREVKRLRQEQRQIKQRLAHYKRDGRLNRHERSRLHQMLDVAANNIRNKRNNGLTRWSKRKRNQDQYAWH